jgi:hypothetical protein
MCASTLTALEANSVTPPLTPSPDHRPHPQATSHLYANVYLVPDADAAKKLAPKEVAAMGAEVEAVPFVPNDTMREPAC